MNIEFSLNTFDNEEWWFDLGISCQKTEYYHNKKMVFAIGLGIATIYIRW